MGDVQRGGSRGGQDVRTIGGRGEQRSWAKTLPKFGPEFGDLVLKAVEAIEVTLEQGGLFLVELSDGGNQGVLKLVVGPDQVVLAVPDRLEGARHVVMIRSIGERRGHERPVRGDNGKRMPQRRR